MRLRDARPRDGACLSALAMQVFLEAFAARLADPHVRVVVALDADHRVGFVDLTPATTCRCCRVRDRGQACENRVFAKRLLRDA
jgi:hypothetical protein